MTDFIFLHGGGQGSWVWNETLAALDMQSGGSARYLALDVPGCGTKRDRDTTDMNFDEIVAELAQDIAGAGFSTPILVGHSQAGQVLPKLEALDPGSFAKHVYVSCVAQAPGHDIFENMRVQIESDPEGPLASVFSNDELSMRELFRVMFVNDMSREDQDMFLDKLKKDEWPQVAFTETNWSYDHLESVPGTYVHCLQDQMLTPHWQRIFAERLRCERTVHIDAAHQVQNTRPHALAEVLLAEAAGLMGIY